MESQEKTIKIAGTGKIIAEKLGCTNDYVSRVLNGRVNQNGKKARQILELNQKIADFLK